jgi:hypothetical protein
VKKTLFFILICFANYSVAQDEKEYDYIDFPDIEGLTPVQLNGKWGFVDIEGNEIIPLIYDEAGNFSDGRARVVLDNREFHINKKGKETGDMRF